MALAWTLPLKLLLCLTLAALGSTYHALQQWEEAHSTLTEAEAVAEVLDLRLLRLLALSPLCMPCALAGEGAAAYRYALKPTSLRTTSVPASTVWDLHS